MIDMVRELIHDWRPYAALGLLSIVLNAQAFTLTDSVPDFAYFSAAGGLFSVGYAYQMWRKDIQSAREMIPEGAP